MTTETTLDTHPEDKSVKKTTTQTTLEEIKHVTQPNTAQSANLEDKALEVKTVSKPAKSTAAKVGAAKAEISKNG